MSFFKEKKLNSLPAKRLFNTNSILTAYKCRHWATGYIAKVTLSKTPTWVYGIRDPSDFSLCDRLNNTTD